MILEIATLVTDDDLQVTAVGPDVVCHASVEQLDHMEDVVRAMHSRSGLLDAVVASRTTVQEACDMTLAFLREHIPKPRTVPLCGNSIATDRSFLVAQMPEVDSWLHYRSVDVSSVKELCRRWYAQAFSAAPRKATGHRAMDDIRESLAELAYYRSTIFRDPLSATQPATATRT